VVLAVVGLPCRFLWRIKASLCPQQVQITERSRYVVENKGTNIKKPLDRRSRDAALKIKNADSQKSRLSGRIVLITGASRGIGLTIAEACAAEGGQVVLVARNRGPLHDVAKKIPGADAFSGDVTDENDVARLFNEIRSRHRRLDVLVNNAGVFTYKPFIHTTSADWESNIRTNLTSLYLVTRAALPMLKRSAGGHIINILSVSSRTAFPNCSAYCASKFGALGFTRVLAEELRPEGIRVTAILPGSTSTRMSNEFDFPVDRQKLLQPRDVADTVLAALFLPARGTMDEVLLTPSQGVLAASPRAKKKK
jgi:NAD(P)-dependent dehydrogenase (short-subunit alcohol dehydrogenase family)